MGLKRENMIDTQEMLLFDILQELRILNKHENENNDVQTELEDTKKEAPKKKIICKTCGTEYNNIGEMLVCARKHKKEGK